MSAHPMSPPAGKLAGLELLRFIAAFGVLIWHYQHFAYVADKTVGLVKEQLPFYRLLLPFYEGGLYGVWIFWCISGFIFFWKYRLPVSERSIGGGEFFVFRLSRLYPLHLGTLLLVAALQAVYFNLHGFYFVYQSNDAWHFLLQLFMASNWGLQHADSFNGPIWSISVEVLVYLVFFVLLRFVSRSALLNVAIIIGCAGAQKFHAPGVVFDCLAFFYIGGLAAMARRVAKPGGAVDNVAWVLAGALPCLAWNRSSGPYELSAYGFLLSWTPILLFGLSRDFGMWGWVRRGIEITGNMTYSSYLLHFPIQLVIAIGFSIAGAPIPYDNVIFFVLFITATLVASHVTFRYLEAPAQDLIRHTLLRDKEKPAAMANSPAT